MECSNNECKANNGKGICGLGNQDKCENRIIKTLSYAEEQLEHAIEKENICFNKQCQHNKNNGCNIPSVTENCGCDAKLNEPINYEEEYYKLKKDNKELKEVTKLEKELTETKAINFGLSDKLETIDDEYQEEITELKKENRDLKKQLENEQIVNRILDDETKDLRQQIERLGKSTNEYYYNWTEVQEENTILTTENEKLKNKVKGLKCAVSELNNIV